MMQVGILSDKSRDSMQQLLLSISISLSMLSGLAVAQSPEHHVHDDPTEVEPFERGFPDDYRLMNPKPEVTTGIQKYAIDEAGAPQENFGVVPIHDNRWFAFLYVDRLEQRMQDGDDLLLWDLDSRIGPDYHKLSIESEGKHNTDTGQFESASNEILYNYTLRSLWDIEAGYRRDVINDKDDRNFAVLGIEGMTPFLFEVESNLYLSDEAEVSASAEIEYGIRISQRSQIIPRFETELAFEDVEEYNIGAGITGFELGLRWTYEIVREIAPYVGVSWEQKTFETANLIEDEGGDTSKTAFVAGLRLVF